MNTTIYHDMFQINRQRNRAYIAQEETTKCATKLKFDSTRNEDVCGITKPKTNNTY